VSESILTIYCLTIHKVTASGKHDISNSRGQCPKEHGAKAFIIVLMLGPHYSSTRYGVR